LEIPHIIFLTYSNFSERDYIRYGIEIFKDNRYNITIFNVAEIVIPMRRENIENNNVSLHVEHIDSLENFSDLVQQHSGSVYISLMGFSLGILPLYRILSQNKCKYGAIYTNAIPLLHKSNNYFIKTINRFKLFTFKRLYYHIKKQLYIKSSLTRAFDFVIVGGEKSLLNIENINHKTMVVFTHTMDYDLFLNSSSYIANEDYFVFLDEYTPYHPDWGLFNIDNSKIADSYYGKMNSFFEKLEKKYHKKIIICAHPRADYTKIGDVWKGREIVYSQTLSYVKNAFACITHASTSTNFAVLFKKPVIFVTMYELKDIYDHYIYAVAKALNSDVLQLETFNIDNNIVMNPDLSVYYEYKIAYIKTISSEEKYIWDIFIDKYLKEKYAEKQINE
jgi:hypothetical protein